ncbi:thiol-disulfide oxidoreductase DCC family protein [uncultured Tenacibaculum sp.]|uniref:thiol-disulfide oxidoreductase DCC family protein n=1 Tax=uncultured Tenacibaculum sp. TaxID=174713 RepID=UPI002617F099|nr:DCC1-like thiol-disulfide oxidoreductase family protein [uncultured Tenacibaculum sp.]
MNIPKDKYLVLFDGDCNLCNSSVQFILKHDKKKQFVFTSLQGKTAEKIIDNFNIDTDKVDSILLFTPEENLFYKSTAALKIAYRLKFPVHLVTIFFILPRFIRDIIYDFIAKNRYKWFGKRESCYVPTPELSTKFLD